MMCVCVCLQSVGHPYISFVKLQVMQEDVNDEAFIRDTVIIALLRSDI